MQLPFSKKTQEIWEGWLVVVNGCKLIRLSSSELYWNRWAKRTLVIWTFFKTDKKKHITSKKSFTLFLLLVFHQSNESLKFIKIPERYYLFIFKVFYSHRLGESFKHKGGIYYHLSLPKPCILVSKHIGFLFQNSFRS